jgi:hypothetical protein
MLAGASYTARRDMERAGRESHRFGAIVDAVRNTSSRTSTYQVGWPGDQSASVTDTRKGPVGKRCSDYQCRTTATNSTLHYARP